MEPGSSTSPGGARGGQPRRVAAGCAPDGRTLVPPGTHAGDDGTDPDAESDPGPDPGEEPPQAAAIAVVVADPLWRRAIPRAEAIARRAAGAALAAERIPAEALSVTILLADDRTLRQLNAGHRGQDKPTNVLSFPGDPDAAGGHLGDLALALGVLRREAAAAGRRPGAHLAHLVAHGTLHLLGHDHLLAGEARRMERAEARVMARLRLPNPWRATPWRHAA